MLSQVLAGMAVIGGMPSDGVQFVIAHNSQRRSGIHHAPNRVDGTNLSRTAVDEVPDENDLSAGMAPGAAGVLIAKLGKQAFQLVRLPVDVSDNVVSQCLPSLRNL